MASKDNRSNRKIDEFFSPTAPGASHVGNNSNAESTAVSNEVEMRGVAEVTERTNVPLDSTQSQSLLELDLPSYPDIENLTDDDLKKDEVRIKLLQGTWDHCHKFKFPSKGIRGKQRKLNHTWLVNNKWLRYSVSRDFVWCVYCVLFGKPERASPNQVGTFSSTKGVSDWGNIGRLVKLHTSQSSPHHDAVIKGDSCTSPKK